jgi:hypothetical protein
MAICKSIPSDYGVAAAYWHIGAVAEDYKGAGVQVTLYGYADEAARRSGKQPLMSATFAVPTANYVADMPRSALYGLIKQDPTFSGGEDC